MDMSHANQCFSAILWLLTLTTTAAMAQQPPHTVLSDSSQNTASGTDALLNLQAPPGNTNSAFGALALAANTTGSGNAVLGAYALSANTTGSNNAVLGTNAMISNTTGNLNVAVGNDALYLNTTGVGNTTVGAESMESNTSGTNNTAVGGLSMVTNTTGSYNSALGVGALFSNTSGGNNVALGNGAMTNNTTGASNTAAGFESLLGNTTGANNTAFGASALFSNTTGKGNAAQGVNALFTNSTGIRNLGIGSNALFSNSTGSYNVALGFDAGYNATGNDNIYFSNMGVAGESQTMRLGSQGTAGVQGSGILTAIVAGVATSQVTGSAVYITSSGQLGVLASSERFKTEVKNMGDTGQKLAQLRPVTFKLKTDPASAVQYGLIAEEVDKVYPELVIHGADGRIDGVRYEELTPMLLNEVQKQRAMIEAQIAALNAVSDRAHSQSEEIGELKKIVAQLQRGPAAR
jgi:hypothetical protein